MRPDFAAGGAIMRSTHIIEADLTWTGTSFEPDIQVIVADDGTIDHVGALDLRPSLRLRQRALLPGMVNAHSHAFQRGLRGRGETFPTGSGSFWSWREEMYALVEEMTPERMYELSRQAFMEMLACGITTVGEFHYLHHHQPGDFALDEAVLQAACDTGIRIVLLMTYYKTGGIGRPPSDAQRRFLTDTPQAFWKRFDALAGRCEAGTQALGAAAHSIRAVPLDDLTALHREARRRGLVFHMHVEEQPKEIEECRAALDRSPLGVLLERLEIDACFTAVHCTHSDPAEMERFLRRGGRVCICPLTEANLGDGIADVPAMLDAGGRICVGTDSNARIAFTEELRWLEYVQRLQQQRRGVVRDDQGRTANALWTAGTVHGAEALGVHAGRIAPGYAADLFTLDLNDPSLAGWTPETLLPAFLFGASDGVVAETCVAGRWVRPPHELLH